MQQIPLRLIMDADPKVRTILKMAPGGNLPFMKGEGDVEYICGNCDEVLVSGVTRDQIANIVFVCPVCGLHNDTHDGPSPFQTRA